MESSDYRQQMSFWKNKKVLVTGGAGFIGSHVVEMLVGLGSRVTVADNIDSSKLSNLDSVIDDILFVNKDLRNFENCLNITKDIEVVINMAAKVGGIKFNNAHPGTMFRENILISVNILEAARISNVERFLVVSSACVYPEQAIVPTPESEGFVGEPERTNDGYGWAKRMAEFQARAYYREYGMKIAIARPYNAYGPRDHFDSQNSHVIPALIKRVFDGEDPLVVWGDGRQTRAFLYVTDFARGIIELIEKYPISEPVNIGTDEEVTIRNLINLILELSGKKPELIFDATRPSGHLRRKADNTKAKEKIGFVAETKLKDGLRNTIEWFCANKPKT